MSPHPVLRNGNHSDTQRQHSNGNGTLALLKWHRRHHGIYARVARRLEVDPSFVSRVANGERTSHTIQKALVTEIERIQRRWPGTARAA